jgi:NAD-dependent SIR2 family protein deacetylase
LSTGLRHHRGVTRRSDASVDELAALVAAGGVTVLSGAGLSTDSGIPDYRGPNGVMRRRTPMQYRTIVSDAQARRRYWARSHVGWRTIEQACPNAGHEAVGQLQRQGLVTAIITQNVDGLHQAGGATDLIELHGSMHRVICLHCGDLGTRAALHRRLTAVNPDFAVRATAINPDGDVELTDADVARFCTVDCGQCGGMLKPDVVFFGEVVPAQRVRDSYAVVESSAALLVLGSSLTVMSGRRFVVRAVQHGIPVAIVNQGATRADDDATIRIDASLSELLPRLAAAVVATPARQATPA